MKLSSDSDMREGEFVIGGAAGGAVGGPPGAAVGAGVGYVGGSAVGSLGGSYMAERYVTDRFDPEYRRAADAINGWFGQ